MKKIKETPKRVMLELDEHEAHFIFYERAEQNNPKNGIIYCASMLGPVVIILLLDWLDVMTFSLWWLPVFIPGALFYIYNHRRIKKEVNKHLELLQWLPTNKTGLEDK